MRAWAEEEKGVTSFAAVGELSKGVGRSSKSVLGQTKVWVGEQKVWVGSAKLELDYLYDN